MRFGRWWPASKFCQSAMLNEEEFGDVQECIIVSELLRKSPLKKIKTGAEAGDIAYLRKPQRLATLALYGAP